MEVIALLGTVFVVSFSGVLMPGPVMTVTIAQAVKRGHLGGPMVTLGHGIAEGTLVILMSLGLSQFFQLPLVTGLIGLLGGILLLYMGIGMIRTPAPESLTSTSASVEGERGPIVAGMIASIANPYWVVWWATIGADFLRRAYVHGVLVIAAFFLVHIAVDLGWNSAMGSAVAAGRRLLTPRIYKGILAVCGTFLLGLGVYFLISGAGTLSQM